MISLIKPGCTRNEPLQALPGRSQSFRAEVIAKEVKAPLYPANEGLLRVFLKPQVAIIPLQNALRSAIPPGSISIFDIPNL